MTEETISAFSSSGEDAIARVIDLNPLEAVQLDGNKINEFYEIQRIAEEILAGDYRRVALQFPDELLHDSVPIYRRLKSKIGMGRELYVLADTSYGSCCVDEVAAQHVNADAMIHFGHACMSQTSRLPVFYVFGKRTIDVDDCIQKLTESLQKTEIGGTNSQTKSSILLKYDVAYAHQAENILARLKQSLQGLLITYHPIPNKMLPMSTSSSTSGIQITSGEEAHAPASESHHHTEAADPRGEANSSAEYNTIFYIGHESLGLTNLLMTNSQCEIISYDPLKQLAQLESSKTNRLLMRRYATVQKARDADVFGILVGTLGVASYLPLIRHLRALLAKHHKKSYTISVGKLNPSKLANFMEIECFVLVACLENSLIESNDFLQSIVTPYELEVALQAEQSWTGRYVLDFEQLLREHGAASTRNSSPIEDADSDQPVFSLVTGKYRHAKRYGVAEQVDTRSMSTSDDQTSLVVRNQDSSLIALPDSAAAQFLHQRSYQGLEVRLGEDEPGVLEQGRSGIARTYQGDYVPGEANR